VHFSMLALYFSSLQYFFSSVSTAELLFCFLEDKRLESAGKFVYIFSRFAVASKMGAVYYRFVLLDHRCHKPVQCTSVLYRKIAKAVISLANQVSAENRTTFPRPVEIHS
jgi:hypothetical protein